MTRPTFGKMKTIVIPYCNQNGISLEEYEKITGVDLKEILQIDLYLAEGAGTIHVSQLPNAITLVECGDPEYGLGGALLPINLMQEEPWKLGVGDAKTRIGCVLFDADGAVDGGYYIALIISGTGDFSLENLKLEFNEL